MDIVSLPINHKAIRWDGRNKVFYLNVDKLQHPYSEKIGGLKSPFAIKNEQTQKTAFVRHKCNERWEVTCMGQTWTLIEE